MDPSLIPPGRTSPTVSPEPSSTRPNPFDDDDASSRKRRRTSASGSSSDSAETRQPAQPAVQLDALSGPGLAMDSAMAYADISDAPQTPDKRPASRMSPEEPPTSSRVTLNLRNARDVEAAFPGTASPHDSQDDSPRSTMNDGRIKKSVEEPELDMSQDPMAVHDVSRASSASVTPPIEVTTAQETDHSSSTGSASFDSSNVETTSLDQDSSFADPTMQFPFRDSSDALTETVNRLAQYIAIQSPLDSGVLDQIQGWLDLYLKFARQAGLSSIVDSCRRHRDFWTALPEVFSTLLGKRSSLSRSPALHTAFAALCSNLAELTALFLGVDLFLIRQWQMSENRPESPQPLLFCLGYLQQFHNWIRRADTLLDDDANLDSPPNTWSRADQISHVVSQFEKNSGGGIESLGSLATGLIEVIQAFPRMSDCLTPVVQVLSDCLRLSYQVLRRGHHDASFAKRQLQTGHELWIVVSSFMTTTMEKHFTYSSIDSVSSQISALTEILKWCLEGDHENAINVLKEHRKNHPELPLQITSEAVAWEWKLDVLGKLVRCSQMQLRVMAVTKLCGDLVAVWKRLCDANEEQNIAFLNHLGSHLLQIKLVDYILGPNCHPEIIVESANIIGFLVVTKLYRAEHTDRLWQGITASQNPRIADALTRMVTAITNLFDYSGLIDLCGKFQTLPIEDFNPALRILWDSVLRELVGRCQLEQTTLSFLPYSICLRLLRESSMCASGSQIAHPEMQNTVMQKFRDLLAYGPDSQGRQELYSSCIEDLAAKSPTTLGSLWGLSMAIRPAIVGEMKVLTEQHDLARLIVEELEHAIQSGLSAGVPVVLSGAANHPRRDFITNLIQLEPDALLGDLGARLWDILVGHCSPCSDDRKSGWQIIINVARRTSCENPFLQICFSQHLPHLPQKCFSEGMLDFVKEQIYGLVSDTVDCALDDESFVANSSIEQLWRIILAADDMAIVTLAIRMMAIDVYLESRCILSYPMNRARHVHLLLVTRCLNQMRLAAKIVKAAVDGTSSCDDEPMVIIFPDEEVVEQERIFTRSLHLLRYFMEAHQSRPHFSAPDLRSLISQEPGQVEGDLTQLKYQSFDGAQQTEVRPLHIGKLNTAGSLLASLKRETGFENYRIFYRGRQFLPSEDDICKSLEVLQVQEGLMLVRREENCSPYLVRIKPGCSPLKIEILSHFQELWEYLSLDDQIAKEIYNFLVKLPADGHMMDLFDNDKTAYKDVFFPGQPFKSLYAVHALVEYIEAAEVAASNGHDGVKYRGFTNASYEGALSKSLHLIVQAISDQELVERANSQLQVQLLGSLMQTFVNLLQGMICRMLHGMNATPDSEEGHRLPPFLLVGDNSHLPSADRLIMVLSNALDTLEEGAIPLIISTLSALLRLSLVNAHFWAEVRSQSSFLPLIGRLLLVDERKEIRQLSLNLFEELIGVEIQSCSTEMVGTGERRSLPPDSLTSYVWTAISSLLTEAGNLPSQCAEFFEMLRFLLFKMSGILGSEIQDFRSFAARTSQLLLEHTSTEEIDQAEPLDLVAKSLALLLSICIQIDETLTTSDVFHENTAMTIFWHHLFPSRRTSKEQPVARVILNKDTRAKLCDVVYRLVRHDRPKFNALLKALRNLVPYYVQDEDDPYLIDLPFQFCRSKALRSPCGYVGLRNLSNTCYLNSLLSQLFMNIEFRQFMMQTKVESPEGSQQLLFHTQNLFAFMQESYRRFVDTTPVVGAIKTYDDTLIDINSQMDVDEFYNLLFDRWEGQVLTSSEKRKLRSFYGGQLVQQVKSQECEHISERLEPFSAIQCDIKGKTSLRESLQAYVDGEIMEGDNKYKCSTCDRHVDAVKRACLKDIPNHLIFHLKRFDFNLRTLMRSKINDYFSFPTTIDMRPYTIEHLSDASVEGQEDVFELVGILVHSGTAESGHYYSYIRERPSSPGRPSWIEFNDDNVSSWDPALMENSTFGGPEQRSIFETGGIVYDKSYSAYMLFYQRASSLREEQQAMSARSAEAPLRVNLDERVMDHLQGENTIMLRRHCLFDPGHTLFVQKCFNQARVLHDGSLVSLDGPSIDHVLDGVASHEEKDIAMEMALSHLDQIVSRAKDTPEFGTFSMMIRSAVVCCPRCALAFDQYFSTRPGSLRSLLQRNPDPAVRTFVGQTLVIAQSKIAAKYPELYYPESMLTGASEANSACDERGRRGRQGSWSPMDPPIIEGTMVMLNQLWRHFHIHIRAWDEYFGTLLDFAKLGDAQVAYLLANNYLLKALRIIVADPVLDLPVNYVRMLNNILRRANSRPPSYASVLMLIEYLLRHMEPVLGPECIVDLPSERLEHSQAPFPWSSDEVQLIHQHPERHVASFFVEKLFLIDQGANIAYDIMERLVATGEQMDVRVLNSLRRNLMGEATAQPLDPFLRAAAKYLEATRSLDHARALIRHVGAQAKSLQNAEGAPFLEFFATGLNPKRTDSEMLKAIGACSMESIPTWAPYLLTCSDDNARYEAAQFMEEELFSRETNGADGGPESGLVGEAIQRLGIACLLFLKETHIRRRAQIGREAATTILRIIGKCAASFSLNDDASELGPDFRALQEEVMGPLRRFIVDEIDDDGSDWDGSCASSEPFEGLHAVHELDEANLV